MMRSDGLIKRTSVRAVLISRSTSAPTSKHSTRPQSITSGITLAMIKIAIKSDAIGSNIVQPVYLIMSVEMMTPTEPKVS